MRNHSLAWYVVHKNLHDDNDDDTTLESVLSLSFDNNDSTFQGSLRAVLYPLTSFIDHYLLGIFLQVAGSLVLKKCPA